MIAIQIPRALLNQLLHQAQASPEADVCGLIGAKDGTLVRRYPIPNAAEPPATRYCMEPAAQIAALRRMREAGETLFGIYHWHPRGAARPSALNIAEAAYPECVYFIISLDTKGVLELSAFRIRDGVVRECELALEN